MNQRCTLALSATPETVLHTAIGGIPPADYEAAYYLTWLTILGSR